jgi:RNA polymerase sigma factor (TIGR02999 family)
VQDLPKFLVRNTPELRMLMCTINRRFAHDRRVNLRSRHRHPNPGRPGRQLNTLATLDNLGRGRGGTWNLAKHRRSPLNLRPGLAQTSDGIAVTKVPKSGTFLRMPDVSQPLGSASGRDRRDAAELLPQVYDELRKLAAAKMRSESDGHTLDATALVNEAWLKLNAESFSSKSAFIRAAAVAMRRILVDHARAKNAVKRGGDRRVEFDLAQVADARPNPKVEAIDESLARLALAQPQIAELVQLRYFVGLSIPDAATILGISPRTADAWWAYARGWLAEDLKKS